MVGVRALAATASIGGSAFVTVEAKRPPEGPFRVPPQSRGTTRRFRDTDPMWEGVPTVLTHSRWEHLSAMLNGGQCELPREQDNWRERLLLSWSCRRFHWPLDILPRSTPSPAFPAMTSSFVTADTRSERFVGRHAARGWVRIAGRVGIASRGVIYLLLAYLALDIARHGSAPMQTSSTGALQELESRSGGKFLLVVLAVGLGCYAAWRLFDAVTGSSRGGAARRISSFSVGMIYAALCVRAVQLVAGHPTSGGASSNPEPWVAKIMGWSGGTVAIEMAGGGPLGSGSGIGGVGSAPSLRKEPCLGAHIPSVENDGQDLGWSWKLGPRVHSHLGWGLSH